MKIVSASRKTIPVILCILGLSLSGRSADATVMLNDWAFNVDGSISEAFFNDPMPTTGTLDSSGLGALSISFTGAGIYSFTSFFDYEIDEPLNSFFNEYGVASGTAAAGQTWEIDEPGYVFGDIYDNLLDGSLDGLNAVPSGLEDDVSFAMGWDFSLATGETAVIDLFLSDVLDTSGFYLAQMDDASSDAIYFWSDLKISGVPEPRVLFLVGIGLVVIAFFSRKKYK